MCHRCGREWDYTGRSDHYGTCPNCKTSVKLEEVSERAEPEPEATAERGTTSERKTVEIEAGGEAREVGLIEAIEAVDGAVAELYELGDARGDAMGDLSDRVRERGDEVDSLEDGLSELAGYFREFVEANGGEIEYENIGADRSVPDVIADLEMGSEASG